MTLRNAYGEKENFSIDFSLIVPSDNERKCRVEKLVKERFENMEFIRARIWVFESNGETEMKEFWDGKLFLDCEKRFCRR